MSPARGRLSVRRSPAKTPDTPANTSENGEKVLDMSDISASLSPLAIEDVVLSPTAAVSRTIAKQVEEKVTGKNQASLTKAMSDVRRDIKSLREDMAAMRARLDIIERNRHRERKAAKAPAAPLARPDQGEARPPSATSGHDPADLAEEIEEDEKDHETSGHQLADLAEEIDAEEIDHELEESIWEAPLVLTLREHGCLGNLFMLILVVFNVFLQLTLIYIIQENLLEDVVTDQTIQDYTKWRRGAGHDMKFMDSQQQSLALQVRSRGTRTVPTALHCVLSAHASTH